MTRKPKKVALFQDKKIEGVWPGFHPLFSDNDDAFEYAEWAEEQETEQFRCRVAMRKKGE